MRSSRLTWIAASVLAVAIVVFVAACKKNTTNPLQSFGPDRMSSSALTATASGQGNTNGTGSEIPAYYDSMLFTIQFVELSPVAERTVLAHNSGLNNIWQSDPGLPGGQPFVSVIDAVPTDGMNPLWREVQITFNAGFTPRQLFSDNEILAAAAGSNPEITLTPTTEVYRCPIVGQKPNLGPAAAAPSSR